ncbi:PTS sugar transporter subunit IIA [Clostridium butyricum]|uniref:PTS sugar transporter subunit IIA n=1 Tax=Clostridium butyricum TaxID=1492 RepID=UPI0029125442|nr:mannose/fructose/sorbose PTS transporter subunit IIA [Clostridioides difficile]
MIGVVVGTHGMFSEEIVKSSEMIFGKQENVSSVTFKPGEGVEHLVEKYKKAIEKLDCTDGILFMVDLFGGSPFNAASMIAMNMEKAEIVTGVNLPMLLEVYGSKEFMSITELVNIAEGSGRDAIKKLEKSQIDEEEL